MINVEWHPEAFDDLVEEAARRLLAAAVTLQTEHMKRINESAQPYAVKRTRNTSVGAKGSQYTAYARPSRPGEYLRKRTGFHQASLIYTPTSLQEVIRTGSIRIGYLANDKYGPFWEHFADASKRRKGLLETLDDLRGKLTGIIAG